MNSPFSNKRARTTGSIEVIEIKEETSIKSEVKSEVKTDVKTEVKQKFKPFVKEEVEVVSVPNRSTTAVGVNHIFHAPTVQVVNPKAAADFRQPPAARKQPVAFVSTRPQRGVVAVPVAATVSTCSNNGGSINAHDEDGGEQQAEVEEGEEVIHQPVAAAGTETDAQQGLYEGQRLNGKPHGQGVMHYNTNLLGAANHLDRKRKNNVYTGEWWNGKKHGHGKLEIHTLNTYDQKTAETNKNCDVYEGLFVDDLFHGQGVYTYNCGDRYEGSFVHGVMVGQAKYVAKSGAVYTGRYENFMRNGQGTMRYNSHEEYCGEWKNGQRHGQGRMVDTSKKQAYEGNWKNGNPSSRKAGWTKL